MALARIKTWSRENIWTRDEKTGQREKSGSIVYKESSREAKAARTQ